MLFKLIMDFLASGASAVWLVLMIIFLVVEAAAPGLVSVWFAVGSLAALVSALLRAPFWLQLVWFFVVSILALVATRPLAKRYINQKTQATNADMFIGSVCVITVDVDNINGTGEAKAQGKIWTARSADDKLVIPAGARAKVERIEGVKLIVSPMD